MAKTVSRRTFVKVAAGLIAFVPAAQVLALSPGSARAASVPRSGAERIENYLGGYASKVAPDNIQLRTYEGDYTLHLSGTTEIWKGKYDRSAVIEVGDRIEAWGQPRLGGHLDVERMWVNIVNLIGQISDIRQGPGVVYLTHQDRFRGPMSVVVDNSTLVPATAGEAPFAADRIALPEGRRLQIIGLLLKDGTVRATRILT